ncbi:hypothetical protein J5N97_014680 [Dioscorea zingiberensis]|uniref:Uncharacterized protein n=1 Tax=Dioscorea zingiberensis TaxID=325984 RepID=A0A9D5CSX8_9LILI|nr:hypothetical protein J5N97_014680 [Dioscorea zingiberensis]
MDMKRIWRHPSPVEDPDPESDPARPPATPEKRSAAAGYMPAFRQLVVFAIAVLMLLPLFLLLSRSGISLDRFVKASFEKEVCEGSGRTLKGRDLSRGFLFSSRF